MEFIKANREKILFSKLFCGDVFYSEDSGGYGMKILEENNINVNSISLADGQLLYIPNNTIVETVKGKFVED